MTKEPDDYRRRWLASHQAPAYTYTCPRCGAESYSPEDAENRYCGRCDKVEEPATESRMRTLLLELMDSHVPQTEKPTRDKYEIEEIVSAGYPTWIVKKGGRRWAEIDGKENAELFAEMMEAKDWREALAKGAGA